MSRDYYEILGVSQTATPASIRRAFQTAKDQIAADESLSLTDRKSRMAELLAAADELSMPAKRARYDSARQQGVELSATGSMAALLSSPKTWMMVVAVAVLVGGIYWQYSSAQTRERIKREQVAAEELQERRLKDIEARRVAEKARLEEELRSQKEADDKQRQEVNEIRSAASQKMQYVTDERYTPPPPTYGGSSYESARRAYDDQRQMSVEARRREMEERQQRYEEEANMRRAKAEVERQKRYLENLEREDQYAKARREAASRPNRY